MAQRHATPVEEPAPQAETPTGAEALLAKLKWQKEHLANRHSQPTAEEGALPQDPAAAESQPEHTAESQVEQNADSPAEHATEVAQSTSSNTDATDAEPALSEDEARRLVQQFHQFSGEIHASVLGHLNQESDDIRAALLQRTRGPFGIADGSADIAAASDTAVWATVLGSNGTLRGEHGTADLRSSSAGFLLGTDFSVSPTTRLGAAAGFSNSRARLGDRYSKANVDTYTLGLYGSTQLDPIRLGYGAAYSWHGIRTSRETDDLDPAKANYRGRTAQLFGEAAYVLPLGSATVEPYLGLAYVNTRTANVAESGTAALNAKGASQGLAFSTLGTRASNEWELQKDLSLTLHGGLGWRHAYGDVTPSTRVSFNQGDSFTVTGVPIARDALVAEAGITLRSTGNMSLGLGYAGQFARKATDHNLKVNASWVF
ncbi:autotransporter outer membrane beta-barrel domain-containing protein [Bordetella sp. H567]|uniref:autotransporter outer membrane beta-barrel domain-containing protein n=1 Tax=Bordetella sp. H567 TaxID=1697043 RepID=UPI001313F2D5|nr:autotransporter domain-containing protein [Bordetella sp. H567]